MIKGYFNSDYFVYSSDVYRIIPIKDTRESFESAKWHFDNTSTDMLKVFVYLNDVTEETGALNISGRRISDKIKNEGLFLRDDIERYQADIEKEKIVVEGKVGTIILFTPHSNVHKATLPSKLYRDAAVFLVYPSFYKNSSKSHSRRLSISRNFGYMINPFNKKPLRSGYS